MDLGFLNHVPGGWRLNNALRRRHAPPEPNPFLRFAPPGHFYSPLPDLTSLDAHKEALFDRTATAIPGIDNRIETQLALIEPFSRYYDELPFKSSKSPGLRYYFDNDFFGYGDAIVLYSMLRHFRPRRIVEIGSGFSSAVMLDTNDLFCQKQIALTFIEPYPERLFSLLGDEDEREHEVIRDTVQHVPLEMFSALTDRDVLFIDSSHVAKIGSDVVHLLTNILPRLQKGVLIHVHDVFWPFEYPEVWIREGRAWNEDYFLKAFLQFNDTFKILFFSSFLATHHREAIEQRLPLFMKDPGGSLWIEKVA